MARSSRAKRARRRERDPDRSARPTEAVQREAKQPHSSPARTACLARWPSVRQGRRPRAIASGPARKATRSAGRVRPAPATAARKPATTAGAASKANQSGRANSICQEEIVISTGPPPLIQAPFNDHQRGGHHGRENPERSLGPFNHQGRCLTTDVAGHAEVSALTGGRRNHGTYRTHGTYGPWSLRGKDLILPRTWRCGNVEHGCVIENVGVARLDLGFQSGSPGKVQREDMLPAVVFGGGKRGR